MQLSSPEDPRSSAHQGLAGVIGCGYPVSALLIRRRHKRLIIAVVKRVGCWNPQNRSTLNENALCLSDRRNVVSGRLFACGMFEHDRRQVVLLAQILTTQQATEVAADRVRLWTDAGDEVTATLWTVVGQVIAERFPTIR